jgi:hypothetical protein
MVWTLVINPNAVGIRLFPDNTPPVSWGWAATLDAFLIWIAPFAIGIIITDVIKGNTKNANIFFISLYYNFIRKSVANQTFLQ